MTTKEVTINNINVNMIKTDKFKSINISLIFKNKIEKNKVTITNFLCDMLTYSTKKYPTLYDLSNKLLDLYNVNLIGDCERIGNIYETNIGISLLNEKYTEKGMLSKSFELLSEVIFNPNVTKDAFDKSSFEIVKRETQSSIERIKENPKKQANLKVKELFDNTSPISINTSGYIEDLNKITCENLYKFYKDYINNSEVVLYVIGNIDYDEIENLIKKYFNFSKRNKIDEKIILNNRNANKKIKEYIENDNTNQSKLCIACLIDKDITLYERDYILAIYTSILGGSPDSKFFKNIREKKSMCYYINIGGRKLDNFLVINSGITKNKYKKVMKLIKEEMNNMEKGNITDEELSNAINYSIATLEEIEDKKSKIIANIRAQKLWNADSIETKKEKYNNVTKDEIVKFAKKVKMDTVLLLGGDAK